MKLRSRLLCSLLVLLLATHARGDPTTLLRYDYEHLARECPYRTRVVDAGDYAGAGQVIAIPAGAKDIRGVHPEERARSLQALRPGLAGLSWSVLRRARVCSTIEQGPGIRNNLLTSPDRLTMWSSPKRCGNHWYDGPPRPSMAELASSVTSAVKAAYRERGSSGAWPP